MPNPHPIKRLIPARDVAERYGLKSVRSLRRWILQGIFPPADRVVNHRNYWWLQTLITFERGLVAEKSNAKKPAAKKPAAEIISSAT